MRDYLFNTEKIKYVTGRKPEAGCVLCAIRDRAEGVESLEITRTEKLIVAVNLYPFNPGHLMIFPARHVVDLKDLTGGEAAEMHDMLVTMIKIIGEEFGPSGYNIGYNLGKGSGASIAHVHQHIVPRYDNEVGFLDVLAGARVVVIDPRAAMDRLKARLK